ncbi:thiol:disulfide interchange protein DsbA/DsbL [Acinetobacter gerneri]|uniref:Thiol:disulfide interchange protein n=1 Tax=Acinetobacter gerneri TaxID=202952 RepID=A0AAW8JM72_9GAMM|nr:thiol:disulfide interchange protein DsbA/DsbL [Acinetobacter gerneri]MDQ9010678.1 thiol:disulfide interchange protein DsbA/DsbL [Acinetobacter gerneri]MDQ9014890.1 thiol:disulfide interchange protein DsbA/DsbL [Acinetobacter gerneri]MDQ9026048.1 thiol:disulfide interchange protein DsbA/DsbL [Acinetobacter gerneri]MDQ9053342.1 thiol:disulfide interchange protein DsbA/DsbL [Acinetobacter gerneri]MDQ9060961.1 thiol:disulfide interchange protein DsbA/DsbL [Acinetobacter gerneri]
MKKFIFGGMTAMVMAFSANAMAADYVAGKDYTVIKNPGKVDVPGKIEVREFFWYGCPHCFKLEPYMQTWLKALPKDVNFVRSPAAMNKTWEQGARAYYVSEELGIRKKTHLALFHAIQVDNQQLFDQASQAQFFTKYGVSEAKFNSLYNSFSVSSKVAKSNQLAQQYQLTGVPAVVVNGKYVVQGEDGKVTQVVNYLIEKERKVK